MTEPTLEAAFDALGPDELTVRRAREHALDAYDVSQRSLALEWLELARQRPLLTTLSLAAAAVVLLGATPIGALALWLGAFA